MDVVTPAHHRILVQRQDLVCGVLHFVECGFEFNKIKPLRHFRVGELLELIKLRLVVHPERAQPLGDLALPRLGDVPLLNCELSLEQRAMRHRLL